MKLAEQTPKQSGRAPRVPRPAECAGAPDLSVIVVTHNRSELALTTLRSARGAIGELDVQWIVVDSGSTDQTPAAIEAAFSDIHVLREANIGFAAANNRGLAHARGRYTLLLNPDVEIASGTFEQLLATLDSQPEIGVASVIQKTSDDSLAYSIRRFPSAWRAFGEAIAAPRWTPLARWREEEPRRALYGTQLEVDWLVGAFLIARSEACLEVGGLDERFFLYSEEIDWCYRFRKAGWKVAHLPVMSIVHHTGGSYACELRAQLSYAKILFAAKHYGRARGLAIRAGLALRHCLRAATAAVLALVKPGWAARAHDERRALAVVLGLSRPSFARAEPAKGRPRAAVGGPA
jgi:GT2 family glycosyltransferase